MPRVARCRGARRLVPNWYETDAYLEAERGIPDACYECPPCRGPGTQWAVTAGHSLSIVLAGCDQAAREAMYDQIYGYRRRRSAPDEVQRLVARPATDEDVARFEQILTEQETGRG